MLDDDEFRAQLCALRLAVLFHHARRSISPPRLALSVGSSIRFAVPSRWLAQHPLTGHLLEREVGQWRALGYPFVVPR